MAILKNKFLKCSFPTCNNTVGQHSKALNTNKQVCEQHRGAKKGEIDRWKISKGCANQSGHYGFMCSSTNILDPVQLDINHIDGNNDNRDSTNVEVLCAMCHRMVTKLSNHHLSTKSSRTPEFADTGLFTGLIGNY